MVDALERNITAKRANVGIIGMGYVGLPLAREFCAGGFSVTGFDIDEGKIRKLLAGKSYIKHIPDTLIADLLSKKRFHPTSDFRKLKSQDAIIICVPTPLTEMKDPDMSYIVNTTRTIARRLRKGQLVVLESTTYPGTTREVMLPLLEATGLKCGKDFFLAFSPEREDPGNPKFTTRTIPKVVGGMNPASQRLAVALYSRVVVKVVPVSSPEAAEAAKILENIYRCVNIALVNELKVLFDRMGIDIWEVIHAASTKPFGFQAFYPGPGLGGHCIPIDPFYLSWKARKYDTPTRFIELAGEINTFMPYYVVNRLLETLSERGKSLSGAKVLVLGIAYKKDVDDMRESPAVKILQLLRKKGACVSYNDPHIPKFPHLRSGEIPMTSVKLTARTLAATDAVLILTDHSAYDYNWIVGHSRFVMDTRNATAHVTAGRSKIVKA